MARSVRLSDVIIKLPDRSTCRIERRLVITRAPGEAPARQHICTLPTGELVEWLTGGKYRLPNGSVGVTVAHTRPER